MPFEVMARRGEDTMRYGPLKPVSPRPENGPGALRRRPAAAGQCEGTLYNLVAFRPSPFSGAKARVFP
jgi:methylenetetrahydrofolate--tRNA-(uracil-5-)-methyltransferase